MSQIFTFKSLELGGSGSLNGVEGKSEIVLAEFI